MEQLQQLLNERLSRLLPGWKRQESRTLLTAWGKEAGSKRWVRYLKSREADSIVVVDLFPIDDENLSWKLKIEAEKTSILQIFTLRGRKLFGLDEPVREAMLIADSISAYLGFWFEDMTQHKTDELAMVYACSLLSNVVGWELFRDGI